MVGLMCASRTTFFPSFIGCLCSLSPCKKRKKALEFMLSSILWVVTSPRSVERPMPIVHVIGGWDGRNDTLDVLSASLDVDYPTPCGVDRGLDMGEC